MLFRQTDPSVNSVDPDLTFPKYTGRFLDTSTCSQINYSQLLLSGSPRDSLK